jgi:8-oxo-dGTP pyrophosphatase MutT (NUDIX family)
MSYGSAPATPRPAATVMVLRPSADGFQVFMVRRHGASKFAADFYVFPGGSIRSDDRVSETQAQALGLDPSALRALLIEHDDPFADEGDGGLSLWIAALRELFEEAGLLLAEDEVGCLLDLSAPRSATRFQRLRNQVQENRLSLAELAAAERLHLAADRLVYFSRWITPAGSPRRFDTRFFVAELPSGQTAAHCQIETTAGLWISPAEALCRHERDDFPMMFVTSEHVRRLAEFNEAEALLRFAREKPIRAILPDLDPRNEPRLTAEQRPPW